MRFKVLSIIAAALVPMLSACTGGTERQNMDNYIDELRFFESMDIPVIDLSSGDGLSRILVAPGYQGRVMTSASGGPDSPGYGWINRRYISSRQVSGQFNPYGGEERFWIGPEGGPFSWYFAQGCEQVFANWKVPAVLDTEGFDILGQNSSELLFGKRMHLQNASGRNFCIDVRRKIVLVDRDSLGIALGTVIPGDVKVVAYRTENTLVNSGGSAWTEETGMPSVWLLGMFSPTPSTTVFIPFNADYDGVCVKDDYFGKIPSDRLVIEDGVACFRIDGKYRSKLGLPSGSAKGLCGSYDSSRHVLNILKYSVPGPGAVYVNGQWGHQEDPFCGDVINSYNDGPTETGDVMGPFYEIETSSPAARLSPGESLTHIQMTVHLEGSEEDLAEVASDVFGVDLVRIAGVFRSQSH